MSDEPQSEKQTITIDLPTADVLSACFTVAARNMDYRDPEHAAALKIGQAFIDMLREKNNGKN